MSTTTIQTVRGGNADRLFDDLAMAASIGDRPKCEAIGAEIGRAIVATAWATAFERATDNGCTFPPPKPKA